MPIRLRKLIGAVALLALVTVWAFLAVAFAPVAASSGSRMLEFAYYFAAGLGWVLPAMPLISWMSRPDVRRPPRG